jgi:hypothetical protein
MGPPGRHKRPRRNSLVHPPTKSVASANPSSFQENPSPCTLQKAPPSSTLQKALLEFTAEELSACLNFLRRDKTAAISGTTTAADSATTDSATYADSRDSYPLHCYRQYVDFRKLSDFDLDFGCFAYKINVFGRKKQRVSRKAVRQAESRAMTTIVSAIMDAGKDDQQRALALYIGHSSTIGQEP